MEECWRLHTKSPHAQGARSQAEPSNPGFTPLITLKRPGSVNATRTPSNQSGAAPPTPGAVPLPHAAKQDAIGAAACQDSASAPEPSAEPAPEPSAEPPPSPALSANASSHRAIPGYSLPRARDSRAFPDVTQSYFSSKSDH